VAPARAPQILLVLAGAARVNHGVELQVDLVDPRSEEDREVRAVRADAGAFEEALREAEVEEGGRPPLSPLRGTWKSRATRSRAAVSWSGSGFAGRKPAGSRMPTTSTSWSAC